MHAALRKNGEFTEDAHRIAPGRHSCGGVNFTCSGQRETQAASLSPILYMYQRQRAVRKRRNDPSQLPTRRDFTVSPISYRLFNNEFLAADMSNTHACNPLLHTLHTYNKGINWKKCLYETVCALKVLLSVSHVPTDHSSSLNSQKSPKRASSTCPPCISCEKSLRSFFLLQSLLHAVSPQ